MKYNSRVFKLVDSKAVLMVHNLMENKKKTVSFNFNMSTSGSITNIENFIILIQLTHYYYFNLK